MIDGVLLVWYTGLFLSFLVGLHEIVDDHGCRGDRRLFISNASTFIANIFVQQLAEENEPGDAFQSSPTVSFHSVATGRGDLRGHRYVDCSIAVIANQ